MRTLLLGLALVGMTVTAVSADALNLFYDVRPTIAEIDSPVAPYIYSASLCPYAPSIGYNYDLYASGGRGDGQMVWVCPKIEDTTDWTGFGAPDLVEEHISTINPSYDWSQADFYLYAEFQGTAGQIVSSIGVSQTIPAAAFAAGGGFYLESANATPMTTTLWDGTNFAGSDAAISMKMVQVPVTAGPAFDNDAAYLNPGDTEQIAKIHLQAAYRNGETVAASYGAKLAVNELLVTRVSYPTAAAVLPVYMGYNAGSLELWGNGTSQIGTNPSDDMVIKVVRKGDFDFNGTAADAIDDYAYWAISPDPTMCNPFEFWIGDMDLDGMTCSSLDDFDYIKHSFIP
jgi:hypothetical protein